MAGAAAPDTRLAKLAWIGARLPGVGSVRARGSSLARSPRGRRNAAVRPARCSGDRGARLRRGEGRDRWRTAPGARRGVARAGLPCLCDRRGRRGVIIDLAEAAENLRFDTDICVIGGGAAGLAIAWHFRHIAGREVTVLEAGGIEFDSANQDLYVGALSGQRYHDLDVTRLRMLGGSTNHWANHVSPFEAIDFEERPWIPHSGWPIRRSDLDAWYPRALEYLQLSQSDLADYRNWGRDEPSLEAIEPPGGVIVSKPFLRRSPSLSVGGAYLGIFETSRQSQARSQRECHESGAVVRLLGADLHRGDRAERPDHHGPPAQGRSRRRRNRERAPASRQSRRDEQRDRQRSRPGRSVLHGPSAHQSGAFHSRGRGGSRGPMTTTGLPTSAAASSISGSATTSRHGTRSASCASSLFAPKGEDSRGRDGLRAITGRRGSRPASRIRRGCLPRYRGRDGFRAGSCHRRASAVSALRQHRGAGPEP